MILRACSRATRIATLRLGTRLYASSAATVDGRLSMKVFVERLLMQCSPIASLLSEDSPKIIMKGGLFDHISRPGLSSFEQNQPKWLEISKV